MAGLKEILLRSHTIDAGAMAQAEQISAASGAPIVHILVRYRVVEARRMARLLSRACHVELIDLATLEVHPRLLEVVPRHAAERLRVMPIAVKRGASGERLYLAMSDPSDDGVIDIVEKATGRTVEAVCCDDDALSVALDRVYGVVSVGVDEPAVVVGAIDPGAEFLTESTTEALRLMHQVQQKKAPSLEELAPLADDDNDMPTVEMSRQPRPVSVALAAALAEVTAENTRGMKTTALPTMQEVWDSLSAKNSRSGDVAVSSDPGDEPLFDETASMARPSEDPKTAVTKAATPAKAKARVALPPSTGPQERAHLRREMLEVVGPLDFDDDAVAACRAVAGPALVLLAPKSQSALLRALLDLEEKADRPRIIILGGDAALRMLGFVDHHADLPDASPRAVGVAVLSALRLVGVKL